MFNLTSRFLRDKSAATSIEYALIASLIGIAIIIGARSVGTTINSKYSAIASKIANPN